MSEVRATSHKPDEIYGLIERLSPGTRKVELFGRPHQYKKTIKRKYRFRINTKIGGLIKI